MLPPSSSPSPAVPIRRRCWCWRRAGARARKKGPKLLAVTVDHGLRRESAAEARAVKRLARRLGVPHRTVRWAGKKPATGLQQAARDARYRLLARPPKRRRAAVVLTAHTLDDQAETVLIRMSRGSGLAGLGAMARVSPLPVGRRRRGSCWCGRCSTIPKARLVATLERAEIAFADDPSNRDPRFTRARLRALMPALAREGLDGTAPRAVGAAAAARRGRDRDGGRRAVAALSEAPWPDRGPIVFDAGKFARLPAEVALRLLGRAIARVGDEGPVRLGKLETLYGALESARNIRTPRLRRTLAGALVTLTDDRLVVERAPARRAGSARLA